GLPPEPENRLLPVARIVTEFNLRRIGAVLLAGIVIAACSKDSNPIRRVGGSRASGGKKIDDSAAGSVDLGGGSYRPGSVAAVGNVAGTIKLEGAVPPPATITVDEKVC